MQSIAPCVVLENRYGLLTKAFCWFGLVFFSGFSLLFIGRFFLGLGGWLIPPWLQQKTPAMGRG